MSTYLVDVNLTYALDSAYTRWHFAATSGRPAIETPRFKFLSEAVNLGARHIEKHGLVPPKVYEHMLDDGRHHRTSLYIEKDAFDIIHELVKKHGVSRRGIILWILDEALCSKEGTDTYAVRTEATARKVIEETWDKAVDDALMLKWRDRTEDKSKRIWLKGPDFTRLDQIGKDFPSKLHPCAKFEDGKYRYSAWITEDGVEKQIWPDHWTDKGESYMMIVWREKGSRKWNTSFMDRAGELVESNDRLQAIQPAG